MSSEAEETSTTATIRVACPDRKGLVAALTRLLYEHGASILDAQQHADPVDAMFFQRIHFDHAELDVSRESLEDLFRIECARFDMKWQLSYDDRPKRVALFVSTAAHCLYDLLIRQRQDELHGAITVVLSNHEKLAPIAQQFDIPFHSFAITADRKAEQERAQTALLENEGIDLVVLARYMQILTPEFVERWSGRVINIHHSFLPAFIGARPYHQAYRRGVKLIGATAHYTTSDLDEGPIIAQDVVTVSHRDTVADLIRKGRDVERTVLAVAVRNHLEDRIIIHGGRTIVL